jgi:Na+/serine symporter
MNILNRQEPTTGGPQRSMNARSGRRALWGRPLYVQIIAAVALGVAVGLWLPASMAAPFDTLARLILRLLGAIAPPLILLLPSASKS